VTVDLQLVIKEFSDLPEIKEFKSWVIAALDAVNSPEANITVRIVEIEEMTKLNSLYRSAKETATNVLAFPFEKIDSIDYDYLGDIVLCAEVLREQAQEQGKSIKAHCAHLVIHGTLHLCGFDHILDSDASEMEGLEKSIMTGLGFVNPYEIDILPNE